MMNSRYRIVAEVGRGQFGQVFCGSDRTTGELVALKNLDHRRFKTRNFLREIAVLIRLDHPNIVSFHALEYNATGRYIVMDYCQGGTLRHLMDSKLELDLIQKLRIVQDILLGLEHAHNRQVIHCDLKPENILLNATSWGWMAQIADFGIAHLIEDIESSDSTGDTGSPAYMAPERFYGKYSPASDLYAIGVILFELVAGKRPFSGMPFEVMNAHFNHPLRIPKPVPMMLKTVIRKALQKLPQNRYTSATQMWLALETVMATLEHAVLVKPDEAPTPTGDVPTPENKIAPVVLDSPLKGPRQMQVQRQHLQYCLAESEAIARLWIRPQGCFIATSGRNGLTLSLRQPDGIYQQVGILPHYHCEAIDLDPLGQWLAMAHPAHSSQAKTRSDVPADSILQILNRSDFQRICQQPIEGQIHRLWCSNRRHFVVALNLNQGMERSQVLQLWNRRGQFYWSYALSGQLQEATLSSSQENRLFAITDENPTIGLLIDLSPFKITRLALSFPADYLSATHWGYILVHHTGHLTCLNRRGRIMAQAQIPLQSEERVTAIASSGSATLWIAIQNSTQTVLYQLDLTPYLPKSLLKL